MVLGSRFEDGFARLLDGFAEVGVADVLEDDEVDGSFEKRLQRLVECSASFVERCNVRLVELDEKVNVAGFVAEVADGGRAENLKSFDVMASADFSEFVGVVFDQLDHGASYAKRHGSVDRSAVVPCATQRRVLLRRANVIDDHSQTFDAINKSGFSLGVESVVVGEKQQSEFGRVVLPKDIHRLIIDLLQVYPQKFV